MKITVCSLDCPDSCSLIIDEDQSGNIRVAGNPDHPITRGFTCAKIKEHVRRLRSPHRITSPLLRAGEKWNPIEWDEALQLCAEKIQRYRDEPSSILHIHGDGAKGVLKCADNLFFGRLGSSRTAGSLCDTAGIAACIADFGSLDSNDITDILHAKGIVNWGKDLSRSSIHVASLVQKVHKRGCNVITISPGGDGNGPFSDYHIRIRPGTDRFLAAAVVRLFIERNTIRGDILERTHNWEAFRHLITKRSINEFSSMCQVSLEDLERLYNLYAGPGPVATLYGWGLQRYHHGGENVRFINALALISGNIGRSGGGSYYNISSLRNFNLDWTYDSVMPGRRSFLLPIIGRSILEAVEPTVKMLWVNGSNIVNQAPDSQTIRKAFHSAEFTVVVDAFMTDTASLADIILPSTLILEQEDIVGSFLHDYVHYAAPVIDPPRRARDDFWILTELGKRLDPPIVMPVAEGCLKASMNSSYLENSFEELKDKRFFKARRPSVVYEGLRFDHPDALYRFPADLHDELQPPSDYPLRLLSLLRRDAIHSQIVPEKQGRLPKVWIAPDSSMFETVDPAKDVFLVSPLGRLQVQVEILSGLHPETAIYRRGDWIKFNGGVNQLIEAQLTDMGNGSPYYSQFVRLEN
ncbi:MAG: molybdopterin-dependent oxidoreductase [Deltaproteobacteria bacterium]|nr:molybdopterin-dependent oxidoreductase [Deltaproteobacteria bacterium]